MVIHLIKSCICFQIFFITFPSVTLLTENFSNKKKYFRILCSIIRIVTSSVTPFLWNIKFRVLFYLWEHLWYIFVTQNLKICSFHFSIFQKSKNNKIPYASPLWNLNEIKNPPTSVSNQTILLGLIKSLIFQWEHSFYYPQHTFNFNFN